MMDSLYRKFNRSKLAVAVAMLAVYAAGTVLAGGTFSNLVRFLVMCFVGVFLPGRILYSLLDINRYFKNDRKFYSIYLVLGMAFLAVFYAVGLLTGFVNHRYRALYLIMAVSILNAVCKYKYPSENKPNKGLSFTLNSQTVLCICLFSFIIFIYTFLCVAKHAHPTRAGQLLVSQDFMWTVGNAESIKMGLPPVDIRFDGVTLKYHYFTEFFTAAFSTICGVPSYDILGFYIQLFMLAFFITATQDLGYIYYSGDEKKMNLFTLSFFALSCLSLWKVLPNGASVFSYSLLETVISNVNSQCTSLAFLAVFCALVVNMARGGTKADVRYAVLVLLTFLMLMFSKSPVAAIVALAMICAAAVNLLTENEKKRITLLSGVIFVVFVAVYFGYLSAGTGKSTMFSLTKTLKLGYFKNFLNLFSITNPALYKISIPVFMCLQFFCMVPFQTFTVVPRMLTDAVRIFKLSFEKLWFYAAIAGGALAFFITYHEAFSQVYFIYVAIFFLNLLAVEYFSFDRLKLKNCLHYGLITLSCITTLFFYTNFGGSGIRQFLFHYDILEKYPYRWCVKAEDELAGQFLHENMTQDELFITNRTHTGQGEGLSNVYTCYSGRKSYMEGFKYTVSNMGTDWDTQVYPRVVTVGQVFGIYDQRQLTAAEISSLCQSLGIKYAVFSTQFEGTQRRLSELPVVFSQGTVTVYQLY